jgi:PAS domain S-box-containing protein
MPRKKTTPTREHLLLEIESLKARLERAELNQIFGVPRDKEKLTRAGVGALLSPDERRRLRQLDEDFFARGADPDYEFRIQTPGGEERYIHQHTRLTYTQQGRPERVLGVLQDITERKRAEQQIQLQLRRISALHRIDGAMTSSLDMRLSLDLLLHEACEQLNVDAASVLLVNPADGSLEFLAGRGFRNPAIQDGKILSGEDVAGQVALQQKRIHIPDLPAVGEQFTRAGLLHQEGFQEYFGVPLVAHSMLKGVLEVFSRAPLAPDDEWIKFLETLARQAAIAVDNSQLFTSLQQANTTLELRVAERTEALNLANRELERANRAKDEFLANMSHELRTPLNGILGVAEVLLDGMRGPLNDTQRKMVNAIDTSGKHLLSLINDILDLSKVEAGHIEIHLESISIHDACQASLALVKQISFKKGVRVHFISDPAFPTLVTDLRYLKQILVNLLSNAVKFTPAHGKVTLQVRGRPHLGLVEFSVNDTGIGIAPEDLVRLFQPFTQVDSSRTHQDEGTGLGLALTRRLTEALGGSVAVTSEVGKGSCFTVSLPWQEQLPTQEAPPEAAHPSPAAPEPGTGAHPGPGAAASPGAPPILGTVLLAEDTPLNAMVVGEFLEIIGHKIVYASTGREALEKAETCAPDIILMDIQMPEMDGLTAIRRLRSNPRFTRLPIIALTAFAMAGDRERILEAGASGYISKPVKLKELAGLLQDLLKKDGFYEQRE